jgi:hypothetical protein
MSGTTPTSVAKKLPILPIDQIPCVAQRPGIGAAPDVVNVQDLGAELVFSEWSVAVRSAVGIFSADLYD